MSKCTSSVKHFLFVLLDLGLIQIIPEGQLVDLSAVCMPGAHTEMRHVHIYCHICLPMQAPKSSPMPASTHG